MIDHCLCISYIHYLYIKFYYQGFYTFFPWTSLIVKASTIHNISIIRLNLETQRYHDDLSFMPMFILMKRDQQNDHLFNFRTIIDWDIWLLYLESSKKKIWNSDFLEIGSIR